MVEESKEQSRFEPNWPLNDELSRLHQILIHYAVEVQKAATVLQEQRPHISYQALAILSMRAVTIHRAIRDLCELGWTPVTSVLIRTLVDLYVNVLAIVINPDDSEFMAFRYLLGFALSKVNDTSLGLEVREKHRKEVLSAIAHLPAGDVRRAEVLLEDKTRRSYWYQPEFANPTDLLKKTKGDMPFIYRILSGSTHGGTVGLGFLDDQPDDFDINQREHPRRTPLAIAFSSRILLELTFLRDNAEQAGQTEGYHFILNKVYLPLRGMIEGPPGTDGSQ